MVVLILATSTITSTCTCTTAKTLPDPTSAPRTHFCTRRPTRQPQFSLLHHPIYLSEPQDRSAHTYLASSLAHRVLSSLITAPTRIRHVSINVNLGQILHHRPI